MAGGRLRQERRSKGRMASKAWFLCLIHNGALAARSLESQQPVSDDSPAAQCPVLKNYSFRNHTHSLKTPVAPIWACVRNPISHQHVEFFSWKSASARDDAGSRRHFYHSNWSHRSPPCSQFSQTIRFRAHNMQMKSTENCLRSRGAAWSDTRELCAAAGASEFECFCRGRKNSMASPLQFELMVLTWKRQGNSTKWK